MAAVEHHLLAQLATDFPDAVTDLGVEKLKAQNPARAQAYFAARQGAELMFAGARAQVREKVSQYKSQYAYHAAAQARQAAAQILETHSEYRGEAGQRLLDQHIRGAVVALREQGKSDAEISAELNDPKNFTPIAFEGYLALGRQKVVAEGLKRGRNNSKNLPPVQRPGHREGIVGGYQDIGALDKQLSRSGNVKDAGRLLAALRRSGR